jgi:glycosyltransferase involved in cell wall biosynthesis
MSYTVGAVVTCHNYGRYLEQCLNSLIAQTVKFDYIIVVNDGSTDNTPEILAKYESLGVRHIDVAVGNPSDARNAGWRALPPCDFLLFVDADNYISENFLEESLKAFQKDNGETDWSVGIVCATRVIILNGKETDKFIPTFGMEKLMRVRNNVDTCSLVRTEALLRMGNWRVQPHETGKGMFEDWVHWLGITSGGWKINPAPNAVLYYRVHPGQLSDYASYEELKHLSLQVQKRNVNITVITLFCGRDWLIDDWFEALKSGIGCATIHLVAVDNSGREDFAELLKSKLSKYGFCHTYVREWFRALPDVASEDEANYAGPRNRDPYALSVHMARLYSIAKSKCPVGSDFVWCIEDDIIINDKTLDSLLLGFNEGDDVAVVTAPVFSRFEDKWLAHAEFVLEEYACPPAPGEYKEMANCGFYCTMFRAWDFFDLAFRPSYGLGREFPFYDWGVGRDIKDKGLRWLLSSNTPEHREKVENTHRIRTIF